MPMYSLKNKSSIESIPHIIPNVFWKYFILHATLSMINIRIRMGSLIPQASSLQLSQVYSGGGLRTCTLLRQRRIIHKCNKPYKTQVHYAFFRCCILAPGGEDNTPLTYNIYKFWKQAEKLLLKYSTTIFYGKSASFH